MKNKKAVSAVIAVVFLILLSIAAVGIIAGVLIPFTRDNLDESTTCVNIQSEISLNLEKSCYDEAMTKTNIWVKFSDVDLEEIYLVLEDSVSGTKQIRLVKGDTTPDSDILSPIPVELPQKGGGEKQYTYDKISTTAIVGAVLNGKECGISDEIVLKKC